MFGFKKGANQSDQNKIRRLVEDGQSAEQISQAIMVDLKCVESFVKKFSKPKKPAEAPPVPDDLPEPPPIPAG